MESYESILRGDEKYALSLRGLYEKSGFVRYRMSKFEEYSLYLENKSFLGGRNIITVTSPGGRLLALKPDITLSIVKSSAGAKSPLRVYYSENTYIPDPDGDTIKEIPQVGVEFLDPTASGDEFAPAVTDIAMLAARSLELLKHRWVLCFSHMGFLKAALDAEGLEGEMRVRAASLISDKNAHGITDLMSGSEGGGARLAELARLSGAPDDVFDRAGALYRSQAAERALNELRSLCDAVSGENYGLGSVQVDFSLVHDENYYVGAVFKGYADGVPSEILTGGRYDLMAQKLGCGGGAVGFCVLVGGLDRLFCGRGPEN